MGGLPTLFTLTGMLSFSATVNVSAGVTIGSTLDVPINPVADVTIGFNSTPIIAFAFASASHTTGFRVYVTVNVGDLATGRFRRN